MTTERNVLLIGGAGYIGSVLCDYLLSRGYGVGCLDALYYGNLNAVGLYLNNPRFNFLHRDMNDGLSAALDGVTDVVLLAGIVGDPITKKYPEWSHTINVVGVQKLLDALNGRGIDRVVFISTCSNYGMVTGDVLADENYVLKPLSLYAEAKVLAERHIGILKGKTDYCATVLRFATAFGCSPRMRFDLTVNEFARAMFLQKPLQVYDANTWRPYCHVQDFCRVIHLVLEAPQEVVFFETFNAGGDSNNYTKRMIVEAVQEQVGCSAVEYVEHGSDARNYKVNFRKIREKLGFLPNWSVENGIRELVDALKLGTYVDADRNRNFYGNYELTIANANLDMRQTL